MTGAFGIVFLALAESMPVGVPLAVPARDSRRLGLGPTRDVVMIDADGSTDPAEIPELSDLDDGCVFAGGPVKWLHPANPPKPAALAGTGAPTRKGVPCRSRSSRDSVVKAGAAAGDRRAGQRRRRAGGAGACRYSGSRSSTRREASRLWPACRA